MLSKYVSCLWKVGGFVVSNEGAQQQVSAVMWNLPELIMHNCKVWKMSTSHTYMWCCRRHVMRTEVVLLCAYGIQPCSNVREVMMRLIDFKPWLREYGCFIGAAAVRCACYKLLPSYMSVLTSRTTQGGNCCCSDSGSSWWLIIQPWWVLSSPLRRW